MQRESGHVMYELDLLDASGNIIQSRTGGPVLIVADQVTDLGKTEFDF